MLHIDLHTNYSIFYVHYSHNEIILSPVFHYGFFPLRNVVCGYILFSIYCLFSLFQVMWMISLSRASHVDVFVKI